MDRFGEMDNMSEENVTKSIIKYLQSSDWFIYSFDFPQSGTGTMILPDTSSGNKNKDSIIPDIIAIKNDICIFFENKDRIVISDFGKINSLIEENKYIRNINKLLINFNIKYFYYGIGLPINVNTDKLNSLNNKTDFILLVDDKTKNTLIHYDKYNLFTRI